jgi:fructose-1,6-bisphosphatase/sedoheptulose 1,7-bisphosphatase-like protein
MDDTDRTRQTARVLELLDESFRAHRRGDKPAADAAAEEACRLDVDVVSVIQGGIYIGEIPNPERDYPAWADYVQAAQEQADEVAE